MTAATQETDPLADTKRPSVSFKNAAPGTTIGGTVVEAAKMAQGTDFEDRTKPATWKNGDPKMSVVIAIQRDDNGQEEAFWATKPSAMLTALQKAQATAGGGRIAVGGHLSVTFEGEVPNLKNPQLNDIKQYSASYIPPAAADPLNGSESTEATTTQPPAEKVTVTKPATKAAAPSTPDAMVTQVRTLITVGMTDQQIADTPVIAAAGILPANVAEIRAATDGAPASF